MFEKVRQKINELIEKFKKNTLIKKIEKKVLGFGLYGWQKDFILNGVQIPKEETKKRGNGKTLASALSLFVKAIGEAGYKAYRDNDLFIEKYDGVNCLNLRKQHFAFAKDLYQKIADAGIKLPEIKFIDEDEFPDRFKKKRKKSAE